MSAELSALVSRLEAVTNRLEAVAGKGGDGDGSSEVLTEYDAFVTNFINPFVEASNAVSSDDVKAAAGLFKTLAQEQRKFLEMASKCSQPPQETMMKLLAPMSSILTEIGKLKDKVFKDRIYSSYVSAINEGAMAFGWVSINPAPAPYIISSKEATQFYTNKVLKDSGDKKWVAAFLAVFFPLRDYVKKFHTTGTCWNRSVSSATPVSSESSLKTKPKVPLKPDHLKQPKPKHDGIPPPPKRAPPTPEEYNEIELLPPPPPPNPCGESGIGSLPSAIPPPPPVRDSSKSSLGGTVGTASKALFAEINTKGLHIGSGLKKVTDDMKTHKNPTLRLQSAVPYKAPSAAKPVATAKPKVAAVAKPPKFELQGKKWIVEYQNDRNDLVITDTEMKYTVYIYKCVNCTIQVKGKVNSIILDSCKKTGVCFDTVVSMVEFVNCQSVKGQVTGKLPTASIEKTDGCQLYLAKESVNCQVISAKSSEMNICIMNADGDYTEYPVVEQFRTFWDEKTKTFITEANAE